MKPLITTAALLLLAAALITHAQPVAMTSDFDESMYQGAAVPSREVVLRAPVEGVLETLAVADDQAVTKDELLAQIDDSLQRIAVEAAEVQATSDAQLRSAQLTLEDAKISLERVSAAFESDAASPWEVRQAKLAVKQAEAEVDAAREQQLLNKATLKLEKQRLERYRITSPFSGRVLRSIAEVGATLAAGDEMMVIVQLDPLEATLALPVGLYDKLEVGRQYRLAAGKPINRTIIARLKTRDRVSDAASGTVRCVFEIPNKDEQLLAGFLVRLVSPDPVEAPTE